MFKSNNIICHVLYYVLFYNVVTKFDFLVCKVENICIMFYIVTPENTFKRKIFYFNACKWTAGNKYKNYKTRYCR